MFSGEERGRVMESRGVCSAHEKGKQGAGTKALSLQSDPPQPQCPLSVQPTLRPPLPIFTPPFHSRPTKSRICIGLGDTAGWGGQSKKKGEAGLPSNVPRRLVVRRVDKSLGHGLWLCCEEAGLYRPPTAPAPPLHWTHRPIAPFAHTSPTFPIQECHLPKTVSA